MRRLDLVPDCGRCAALCCIATSFDASEAFAFDKPAGVGCRYLTRDCRCAIHEELVVRGFPGCAAYNCYGAGQRVVELFDEDQRHEAFLILRVVHELLWLLTEAAKLCPSDELSAQIAALDALADLPATDLFEVNLRAHRDASHTLLRRVGSALGGRHALRRFTVLQGQRPTAAESA